ncbi:MAG TPA: hypothetical protein VF777_13630 [Phycisphaerales bacterium]
MHKVLCVAALACAAGATNALAGVNNTWDWKNCCRDLYITYVGGNYDLDNVNLGFDGQGNAVTLKTAFNTAIAKWNAAQANNACKWNIIVGPAMNNCPEIKVMLGAKRNGNQPTDENGVPRFNPPPSTESDFEDPNWPDNGGNGAGPYNGLAFFHRNQMGNMATSGEIVFNPDATWGLVGAMAYDPVITSLHELGHAMRLEHMGAGILNDPHFGSIMGPKLKAGVHSANPDANGFINPSMGDIADLQASCVDCIPSPGGMCVLACAGLAASRRRRTA